MNMIRLTVKECVVDIVDDEGRSVFHFSAENVPLETCNAEFHNAVAQFFNQVIVGDVPIH
ncbi:MAG: hypothetical protein KDA57_13915 [Planctomycetales bacterium]|nr:hypothetical protein [Planctomycetales bacterium]